MADHGCLRCRKVGPVTSVGDIETRNGQDYRYNGARWVLIVAATPREIELQARIKVLEDRYTAEVTESARWNALYCQELGRTRTLTTAGQALAAGLEQWNDIDPLPLDLAALATWEKAVAP